MRTKLQNRGLHNFYSSPNSIKDKPRGMRWCNIVYIKGKKCMCKARSFNGTQRLVDQCMYVTDLKWTWVWTEFVSGYGTAACICEHGNKLSYSIKAGNLLTKSVSTTFQERLWTI